MKHIAIAGLGVVGGGVAEILLKNAALLEKNAGEKIVLKAIYTRTPKKDGPFAPYFVSDFSAIEQDPEIDLVVETIGGSTVALDFVRVRSRRASTSSLPTSSSLPSTGSSCSRWLRRTA